MTRLFMLLTASAVLALSDAGPCPAEELSPEAIISRSWELFRQVPDEKETVKIVVAYKDGRREEKKLVRWTRFDPGHEDAVTIKFTDPPLDRGLGLLTLRHASRQDDQWLKLPSFKKVRKIAAGEQEKYFAGTDFSHEDIRQLIGERTQDFNYGLSRSEGGSRVIEAAPGDGVETGYGRRLIWVNEQFAITKVEYYDPKGELIKTQTNSGITLSEKGLWRTDRVEVENRLLQRKTTLDVEQREMGKGLSPAIFSKDHLESERL